jgi:hypothetical protein
VLKVSKQEKNYHHFLARQGGTQLTGYPRKVILDGMYRWRTIPMEVSMFDSALILILNDEALIIMRYLIDNHLVRTAFLWPLPKYPSAHSYNIATRFQRRLEVA